ASPVGGVEVESMTGADGQPVTRVRVSLVEPVSHRVRSHRNVIVVELDPDAALTASASSAVARADAPADAPATQTVLRAVRAEAGERGTTLTLIGSGPLAATRVQRAGADRLFVDLPGVVADVPPVTVVGQGAVERVRVALNSREPLVTRVVVDLARPVAHSMAKADDGREIRLTFHDREGEPADPSPAATADAPSAPDPAQVLQTFAAAQSASQPAAQPAPAQPGTTITEGEKQYTGHPISLDFQGADLRAVLRTFAEISGLNIVIDPTVQGSVDVALRDVPWDQALDIILRANKLGY